MEGYVVVLVVLGSAVTALVVVGAIVLGYKTRTSTDEAIREMNLNAPLLPNSTAHRLDAALREAGEGYNACALCGFANFKRFPFCNVCGERIAVTSKPPETTVPQDRVSKTTAEKKKSSFWTLMKKKETSTALRVVTTSVSTNTLRHQRARQRKEWVRRLDVDGNLFWYRDGSVAADSQFPGLVLKYRGEQKDVDQEREVKEEDTAVDIVVDSGQPGGDTEVSSAQQQQQQQQSPEAETPVVPDTPKVDILDTDECTQKLEAIVATLSIELLESTAASPGHLPLTSASDPSLSWENVLAMASQAFTDKYAHFVTTTAGLLMSSETTLIKLRIDRASLLEESVESLSVIPVEFIRAPLRIHFIDEAGVDAGGLQREWFVLLNELLADPASGVFRCINKVDQTFSLNPNSRHDIGKNHLMYFYAAGRLVGRALLEGQALGFHLSLPLLKIILGLPVSFSDLEYFDPEAYKSMKWIMENDGVDALGLDFSVTEKLGDNIVTIDLIPNGHQIDLTDDNKDEYLACRFQYLLFGSVSNQLYVFLKGLYEVIPQELLVIFDPEELDYLLCGSDEIDVDDWQKNTKYTNNLQAHSAMIWFWEIVREMPNEYRRRLLHFATGSSRVPISGFSGLTSYDGKLCPFTLKGVRLKDDGYIWSHACFNRLDLPLHVVRDELKAVMYASVETDMYGFTTD